MPEVDPPVWYANLLGATRVQGPDGTVDRLRTRKAFGLLAFLLLNRSRVHSRDELAERFWPDDDLDAARGKLRLAIHSIRGSLDGLLHADRFTVGIAEETSVWSDRDEFLRLAGNAPGDREKRLRRAVELVHGPLLPGFYEDWVLAERERLELVLAGVWRELGELYAQSGRWSAALDAADKLVAIEPYDEAAHLLALRSLRELGRHEAVLRYVEWTRERFAEFGSRPGAAIEAFAQASGTFVEDNQEPAFLGREVELAETVAALEETGIVTPWGPPGVGKSRLAQEAAKVAKKQGSRIATVSAAGINGKERLIGTLRPLFSPEADSAEKLSNLVEAAPPMLVVLDDVENLSDDAVGLLVKLRKRNPDVRFLLTSQRKIEIADGRLIPILPLPIPPPDASSAQIAASVCVRLLRDRVRERGRRLRIEEANADGFGILVRQLEGLPLALELAAEWLDVLSPAEIVSRLEESGRQLAARLPGRDPRHLSLDTAIAASFARLGDRLTKAMSALSICIGDWDYPAAAALLPDDDAAAILADLEGRALIQTETVEGKTRYRMLRSIARFAHGIEPEANPALLRHANHFAAQDPQALGREDSENVRLAIETLLNHELDRERVGGVVRGYLGYWRRLGQLKLAERFFRTALENLPIAPSPTQARLYGGLGLIGSFTDDFELAEWGFLKRQEVFLQLGDEKNAVLAEGNVALARMARGDFEGAVPLLRHQVESIRQAVPPDKPALMYATHNLGDLLLKVGEEPEGTALLEESLRLAIEVEQTDMAGASCRALGWHLRCAGHLPEAEPYLRRSLELSQRADPADPCFSDHAQLSILLTEQGDLEGAQTHLAAIVEPLATSNRAFAFVETAEAAAWLASALGRPESAARLLGARKAWQRRSTADSLPHATRLRALEADLCENLAGCFAPELLRGETLSKAELVREIHQILGRE